MPIPPTPLNVKQSDQLPGGIDNLCPFGCILEDLDHIGHCHHLLGFTNDGITYEPQRLRMRRSRDDEGRFIKNEDGSIAMEPDGAVVTDGRRVQQIQRGDIVKNVGVSSRVYRQRNRVTEPAGVTE